jgi:uncharacterized YccA/Bax inhibitor family protein
MQAKVSKIVLIVVGVILLVLGLFNTGSDILGSYHSSAQTLTLMVRTYWVLVAACGALLCIVSLFIGKKHTLARIFGVGAVVVGGVFAIWGLTLVLDHNTTIDVNGVPSSDPWIKASVLVVGLVFLVIGILTLKAKPYQPKE